MARTGSGSALAAQLADLGYDRGDLSPELLDALFALPSARVQAFLDWFLASVTPQHSVAAQLRCNERDYAIYTALLDKQLNHGLLFDADELQAQERACLTDVEQQSESLETLRRQNADLELDIAQLEAQLQRLDAKNDRVAKMVERTTAQTDARAQRQQQETGSTTSGYFREVLHELRPPHVSTHHASAMSQRSARELSDQIDQMLAHLTPADARSGSGGESDQLVALRSTPAPAAATVEPGEWRTHLYQQPAPLAQLQDTELRTLDELKATVASIVLSSAVDAQDQTNDTLALATATTTTTTTTAVAVDRSEEPMTPPRPRDSSAALTLRSSDSTPSQRQQQQHWLHDTDPATLQLHEQDALLYNRCSLELARLEAADTIGEQDALLARMHVAKNEALVAHSSVASRSLLLQQLELMSPSAVHARQQQLERAVDETKRETHELVTRVLPSMFREMAFLKSTTILLRSYEQKLWRQEHRFLQLRQLLDALDRQHGRLQLVHRFLDAEQADLDRVDTALSSVVSDIEAKATHAQARVAHIYDTPTAADSSAGARRAAGRASIPDADRVGHALFDYLQQRTSATTQSTHLALPGATRDRPFQLRTYGELVRLGDRAHTDDVSLNETLELVDDQWQAQFAAQRTRVQTLWRELFGDASSATPVLVPPALTALLQDAVAAKEYAEQELHSTLESLRIKRRALVVDPSMREHQQANALRLRQELEHQGKLDVSKQ